MRTTLFFFIGCFLVACGGSEQSTSATVVDDGVTRVTLGKGVLGGIPDCLQDVSASYDRRTHELAWDACTADAGSIPAKSRVLNAPQAAQVEDALKSITLLPAAQQVCDGYDGLDYFLTTADSAGHSTRYSAGDINCYGNKRVSGLPSAYRVFDSLR